MKFAKLAVAALALAATPALANDQVVAGATVTGPEGNPVGTIESVADGIVTLDTGTYKAPVPANAFGAGANGPTITVTKAQLNEMMAAQVAQAEQQAAAQAAAQAKAEAEAAAARDAALIVGAPVITADAQPLGMVDQFAGENVVVKSDDGTLVTLPRTFFAVNGDGALMALAEFDAIMAAVNGG